MSNQRPALAAHQLADLLNLAIAKPRCCLIDPVVVASWHASHGHQVRIEHWVEEVLRECGVLPAVELHRGRRISLLPPPPQLERFLTRGQREWLSERQERRRRSSRHSAVSSHPRRAYRGGASESARGDESGELKANG